MTVSSEVARTDYVGNGSVAAYATTFVVKSTSEVRVFVEDSSGLDSELALGADYSAVLSTTGLCTITLTAGNLAHGYKLSLQRGIPYTQTYNPAQSGSYNPTGLATAVDRLAMQLQRIKGDVARAIKIPYLEAGGDSVTKIASPAASRSGKVLAFGDSGEVEVIDPDVVGRLFFNVTDYGALGDGVTDDADAIRAAQVAAGPGGVIYFPPSDTAYMIGSSIVPTCSWLSFTRGQVTIKALAGFVGDFMLSCDTGSSYNTYDRISFDANFQPVHTFGGTVAPTGQTANRGTFINCQFIQNGDGHFPLYGENGHITGSYFLSCEFIGLYNWFHLGVSEDDIYFQSCRFHHNYVNTDDFLFYNQGNNNKLVSCYLYLSEQSYAYAGVIVYGAIGSYNMTFDQCHFEYGHADAVGVLVSLTPAINLSLRSIRLNLEYCTTLSAFLLTSLSDESTGIQKFFSVDVVEKYDVNLYSLLSVYCADTMSDANDAFVTFQFSGCDQFAAPYAGFGVPEGNLWITTGFNSRSTLDPVKPHGVHKGIHYRPREPGSYFGNGASPLAFTIQLKRAGWCLMSINAYIYGHSQASHISGMYWVHWDGLNAGTIGQLGATAVPAGLAPGSLTLGAPNSTGVIALAVAWTYVGNPAFDVCVDVGVTLPNEIYNHPPV